MSHSRAIFPDMKCLRGSELPLSEWEMNARLAAEWIVRGLNTAPKRSPTAPCVAILPIWLSILALSTRRIAQSRGTTFCTILRLEHGKLLDAAVAFANSIWTPEETEMFENCDCQHHQREEVKGFEHAMFCEARNYCPGYSPLQFILQEVFRIISEVALNIRETPEDSIKLERNPKKRGKWPSSPSKFIPKGAAAAVSAFTAWTELADNAIPLRALCVLIFCCPSLDPVLSQKSQSDVLLFLISNLFTEFVHSVTSVPLNTRNNPSQQMAVEDDITNFFYIFNDVGFRKRTIPSTRLDDSTAVMLVDIYNHICVLIPLLDKIYIDTNTKLQFKGRFSCTGMAVHAVLSTSSSYSLPFHPVLASYYKTMGQSFHVISYTTHVTSLQNQSKCAHIPCKNTSETIKKNLKICSRCHIVRYCSQECQAGDWKLHKLACKGLTVLVPVAASFEDADPMQPAEELQRMLHQKLVEGGLTEREISDSKEYVVTHATQALAYIAPDFVKEVQDSVDHSLIP